MPLFRMGSARIPSTWRGGVSILLGISTRMSTVHIGVECTEGTVSPAKPHLPTLLLSSDSTSEAARNPSGNRLVAHEVHHDLRAIDKLPMGAIEGRGEILLMPVLHESVPHRVPRDYSITEE